MYIFNAVPILRSGGFKGGPRGLVSLPIGLNKDPLTCNDLLYVLSNQKITPPKKKKIVSWIRH